MRITIHEIILLESNRCNYSIDKKIVGVSEASKLRGMTWAPSNLLQRLGEPVPDCLCQTLESGLLHKELRRSLELLEKGEEISVLPKQRRSKRTEKSPMLLSSASSTPTYSEPCGWSHDKFAFWRLPGRTLNASDGAARAVATACVRDSVRQCGFPHDVP